MADKDTKSNQTAASQTAGGARSTATDSDSKNTLPKRDTKVSSKKEDGFEVLDVPGSSLEVKRVDTEDDNYTKSQDEALLRYKVTGVVGTFRDPLRDQEPDIAPEFGVAPHPELQNPPTPENSVGSTNRDTVLTQPIEDKVKNDDPSVAQGINAPVK